MKVLIVDDNPQMRDLTKSYLHNLAQEIRECADGADALAVYESFLPDWVLMDWEMKRMNGLAATKQIIKKFPEANILMVTQYDDDELRSAAQEAGALGFVSKDDLQSLRRFIV